MASASERSWAVFPAGSLGEYNLPRDFSIVLARGEGATAWDTEGRAFTDFTMGCHFAAPPGAGERSTGAMSCMSGSSWSVSAIFV